MLEYTVLDLIELLNEYDAGLITLSIKGKDKILYSVSVLGGEGTQEILDAMNETYERQDREAKDELDASRLVCTHNAP